MLHTNATHAMVHTCNGNFTWLYAQFLLAQPPTHTTLHTHTHLPTHTHTHTHKAKQILWQPSRTYIAIAIPIEPAMGCHSGTCQANPSGAGQIDCPGLMV